LSFILSVDPVRPWSTLLSGVKTLHLKGIDDSGCILGATVSGSTAIIEVCGSGFESRGVGLAASTRR